MLAGLGFFAIRQEQLELPKLRVLALGSAGIT
jgi:hypothetical protein